MLAREFLRLIGTAAGRGRGPIRQRRQVARRPGAYWDGLLPAADMARFTMGLEISFRCIGGVESWVP